VILQQQEYICQKVYSKPYQYEWQYAIANAAEGSDLQESSD
jgi:hypothetical protein